MQRIESGPVHRHRLQDHGRAPTTDPHFVHVEPVPFDRLLVAQAQSEGIMLITADTQVAQYPGPVRKV